MLQRKRKNCTCALLFKTFFCPLLTDLSIKRLCICAMHNGLKFRNLSIMDKKCTFFGCSFFFCTIFPVFCFCLLLFYNALVENSFFFPASFFASGHSTHTGPILDQKSANFFLIIICNNFNVSE